MLRWVLLSLMASGTAHAETVSDAFGILPKSALSEERAAWAGLQKGNRDTQMKAEVPAAMELFVGPKSLVAGKDDGHAVALVFDRHGNLLHEGEVTFELSNGGTLASEVFDGIADVVFTPDPVAGTYAGGAQLDGLQTPRALYRVVADIGSVQPNLTRPATLVSESFAELSTRELADQFGNAVDDGVGSKLLMRHLDGTTSQLSFGVREGRAEASFLVRDVATGGRLNVTLGANTEAENFGFQSVEASGAIRIRLWPVDELNATAVRIGPISTNAGHLLNDGAPVTLTVSTSGQKIEETGWLKDGYFDAQLPLVPTSDVYLVTVTTPLGVVSETVALGDAAKTVRGSE